MDIKLAEALLRRKELQQKVDQLRTVKEKGLFEVKADRRKAHEGIDDVVAAVPKVSLNQVTHAFDWHSKQLRKVDAAIQQANWMTSISVDDSVMEDYVDPYVDDNRKRK